MRPWKKRGFLHWLFFQDPGKKKSRKPRKPVIHKPKLLETSLTYEDSTTTGEVWAAPVMAYPVPNGEEVLEANIIDFVESDFDETLTDPTELDNHGEPIAPAWEIDETIIVPPLKEDETIIAPSLKEDETIIKENDDDLPAYIREANEELPLGHPALQTPPTPPPVLPPDLTPTQHINQTHESQVHEAQTHEPQPQTTQTCDKCGTISKTDDNFCGRCGAPLTKPQAAPVNVYCGNCGAKNEHMLKYCGDCGHKLVIEE